MDSINIEWQRQEAERLGKEMAELYEYGYMERLRESDRYVRKFFQQRYDAIKYQLEFGIITEEDYYRMLEEARDEFFQRDTQEWYKYTEEIYSYRTSKIEEYEKLREEEEKANEEKIKEAQKLEEKANEEKIREAQKLAEETRKLEEKHAAESKRLAEEERRETEKKIAEQNKQYDEIERQMEEQQKAYIDNIRGIYNEISNGVNDTVDDIIRWGTAAFAEVEKQRQNYSEKLKDYAGSPTGFDTHVTWVDNYWPTGDPLKMVDYSLVDYEKEIEKLKSFNDSITKLRERAGEIDKDVFAMFFDELRDMSVEDAKILTDLLLEANDEDFVRHFELYEEKQNLAENMSTNYYGDEFAEIAKTVSEELTEVFEEIPDEFFEYGEELGEVVLEGMLTRVNDFLRGIVVETTEIDASQNTTNVQNTEFSPVYYFYGDRSSTSRTRLNAKNDALFAFFRGLF